MRRSGQSQRSDTPRAIRLTGRCHGPTPGLCHPAPSEEYPDDAAPVLDAGNGYACPVPSAPWGARWADEWFEGLHAAARDASLDDLVRVWRLRAVGPDLLWSIDPSPGRDLHDTSVALDALVAAD